MIAEAPKAVFPVPQAISHLVSQVTGSSASPNSNDETQNLSEDSEEHESSSVTESGDTTNDSSHYHESHSHSHSEHHTHHNHSQNRDHEDSYNHDNQQPQSPVSNWMPSPISTHNPWNNRPLSAFDPDWAPSPIEPSPVDHHFPSHRFHAAEHGHGQTTTQHHDNKQGDENAAKTNETRS